MLNPGSAVPCVDPVVGLLESRAPCKAVKSRFLESEAATEGVIDDGNGVDLVTRDARGLFLWCRSCVQRPFMLEGAGDGDLGVPLALCRCRRGVSLNSRSSKQRVKETEV